MENETVITLNADESIEAWASASRAKMQRLTDELTGTIRTAEMALDYEAKLRELAGQKREIDEKFKNLAKKYELSRDKWYYQNRHGVKAVIKRDGEFFDVETNVAILDLQTLEQVIEANPQLKIEWEEYAEI